MSLRESLKATLTSRILILAVGLFSIATFGHAANVGPQPANELASLPGRWDAGWYLGIASGGYRWEGPSQHPSRLAFFPAFPMAVRGVARVLHLPDAEPPWLWTGVILSTGFFLSSLVYLYRLVNQRFGSESAATSAVWLMALYPFSIFHGQMYSESLFLLCAIGATFHIERSQPWIAAIFGVVAGLTRPVGCLVSLLLVGPAIPALVEPTGRAWYVRTTFVLACVSPFIGTLLYSAYVYHLTGGWFTWLSDQEGWGRTVQNPVVLVGAVVAHVREVGWQRYLLDRPYECINVVAFAFMATMAVPVSRRIGVGPALFMVAAIVLPLRVGGWASMGRYTAVLFPAFMWLGTKTRGPVVLVIFAALQALMAALYYTDRPVF
ncbi:MAG: mannosyltransferase family protein [Acidobacteriota bacterium]